MLDRQKTVLQEVYQVVPHETVGFVRNVLGAFLFSGKDVDKVIGILSGGERARVSLAKLLVKPENFMVMDEPTNHLDISSSEKLTDALAGYKGTLLFVSHNQSFINRLATKIWDIREGKFVEYPGNLDEYYDHLARLETSGIRIEKVKEEDSHHRDLGLEDADDKVSTNNRRNRKARKRERAEKRRLIQDSLKPILAELEELEKRIAGLESRQKELENLLKDPEVFRDQTRSVPMLKEYNDSREILEGLLLKWEKCQMQLETTKKNLGL
jgi:ATP-binding cassette subfamily F protein 3